jgi:hypothetical protein
MRISRDPLARNADPNPLFCWLLFSVRRWPVGASDSACQAFRSIGRLGEKLCVIGQDAPKVPKS